MFGYSRGREYKETAVQAKLRILKSRVDCMQGEHQWILLGGAWVMALGGSFEQTGHYVACRHCAAILPSEKYDREKVDAPSIGGEQ